MRWTVLLLPPLLLAGAACRPPARAAEARRAAAEALPPVAAGAEWQIRVEPDTTPVIVHRGSPLVTAIVHGWGPNWQYAGADLRRGADGALDGRVEGLGLVIGGRLKPADGALEYAYHFTPAAARPGATGVCLEWSLRLEAPSLAGAGARPELLEGNRGWRWPIGDQAVSVTFEPAAAAVGFERGDPHTIRTWFYQGDIPAGTREVTMTVRLPAGGRVARSADERYGPANAEAWTEDPLPFDASPVDLSGLNEKPAGRRGFVRAEGDRLVFADGTPARFWGGNLAAYALFVPDDQIAVQAKRIAALGYNLMRIHHHDSTGWVSPTVIDKGRPDSGTLDAAAMARLDAWIAALKAEGVYVWLDLHVGRIFKPGDGDIPGWAEIERRGGEAKGFCYYNPTLEALMRAFNETYLNHVNPHTGLAYKADPAIMGLLITNENDLPQHFGNLMLGDKNNPHHNALFEADVTAWSQRTGRPRDRVAQTWVAGPSKLYLNDREAAFGRRMLDHLLGLGVQVPVATTNFWGNGGLYTLPALSLGGVLDAHSYGGAEALSANPLYDGNFIAWIGGAQVVGKPLTVTEWNTPYPTVDRFCSPLYVAAVGALQGWDAPMIYNYSQDRLQRPDRAREWSTFMDPAISGVMPAAALAFRRGDIAEARGTHVLQLSADDLFGRGLNPDNTAAIRTLVEQRKLMIGLPDAPELDWDAASTPPPGATVSTDPDESFLPAAATRVASDTGQLARDWELGIQLIDTPRTQAASGWIGGHELPLSDLTVAVGTPKAVVVASSLDGRPLRESERILLTCLARVVAPGGRTPFRAEPVTGRVTLRNSTVSRVTCPLPGATAPAARRDGERFSIELSGRGRTHWFVVER